MEKIRNFLLDLLFPIQCLGCNKEGEWLCQNCLEKIKINSFKPSFTDHSRPYLTGVWVATDYSQLLIQKILHSYKYNFVSDLGERLGDLLLKFLRENRNLNFDFIVPVPLAKKRIIWRGFNQAEILAQKISQEFNWPIKSDLILRNYTHPQVGLNAKDRKINIKGVFKVSRPELLKNKTILLVDDVITTGATIGECAKVLKQSGAREVRGLVIAKG